MFISHGHGKALIVFFSLCFLSSVHFLFNSVLIMHTGSICLRAPFASFFLYFLFYGYKSLPGILFLIFCA